MTLDGLPPKSRAIIHDLATSAERLDGRPPGRELVVDLNAAAQAIADAVRAHTTTPRAADAVTDSFLMLEGDEHRVAYMESILALTPSHRATLYGPYRFIWTNERGLWSLTINFRDIGHQPIVEIVMPLMGTQISLPLPDHDVDYVRAILVILGAIEPGHG